MRDPATGESKNYGFVSFDSFEASDAAIEALNNQYLANRPMTVDYAEKKDARHGEKHGTAAELLAVARKRARTKSLVHCTKPTAPMPPRRLHGAPRCLLPPPAPARRLPRSL